MSEATRQINFATLLPFYMLAQTERRSKHDTTVTSERLGTENTQEGDALYTRVAHGTETRPCV